MIQLRDVRKTFGPVLALDGVSLSIEPGERVAFIGANGSGKTTLLRALLGLIRFEGRVSIGGSDVARAPESALEGVAYIPQVAPPLEASVAEVVRAHAALRGRSSDATRERARQLGLDLAASWSKRFRDLSGGMRQKLLAAMALAADAPILVCDEPTANLDGEARAAFIDLLEARPKASIVVLCSHRIEEVRALVTRVVELSDGRVVRDAPLTEVLRDLKTSRMEVVLRDGAAGAEAFLVEHRFSACGKARLCADLAQHEKVPLMARLLAEHGGDVLDVSVTPIDALIDALIDDRSRAPVGARPAVPSARAGHAVRR